MGERTREEEFDEFVRCQSPALLDFAYWLVGDADEARELVQETMVRAWSSWSQLGAYESPEAWMRQVLRNVSVGRWRRREASVRFLRRQTPSPEPSFDQQLDLVRALRRLPRSRSEPLVLHYIADLPVAQVARELGVPEGTVKTRLARGREQLAGLLALDPAVAGKR